MPPWLTRLGLRLRAAFRREHDRQLRQEMQLHLQLLEEEYLARGLSPSDAKATAHREFGNVTRYQEASHELFSFRLLEELVHDLAYAAREMRRSVGFTIIAIGSLALAFGAVTSTFAVIDAFLLRGLVVFEPHRLVAFSVSNSQAWRRWSHAQYRYWRARSGELMNVTASMDVDRFAVSMLQNGRLETGKVRVNLVSGNYFQVLGTPFTIGSPLTPDDDRIPGNHRVAVITEAFWTRAFGAAPDVIGRSLHLNGVDYDIVGVTARGFTGEWIGQPTDVWLPLAMHGAIFPTAPSLFDDAWGSGARPLRVIGRLGPDVELKQAEAQVNVTYQQFVLARAAAVGSSQLAQERSTRIDLIAAGQGYSPERAQYLKPLMVLTAIVVLVLVVAFANFANLLLARAQVRQSDYTVRLALGASRWRLVRQTLTECLVLGAIAGVLGLVAAFWGTTAVLKQLATTVQPMEFDLRLNVRILALDVACIALVILVGLWPAIRAAFSAISVPSVQRTSNFETRRRTRLSASQILMGGQLALCTVLLIAAALLLRTVINLRGQPLGFDRNVLLVSVSPRDAGYQGRAALELADRIEDRLEALPGVVAASASGAGLLNQIAYWIDKSERLSVDTGPVSPGTLWTSTEVAPGFFRALAMPLLLGRELTDADMRGATGSVVINRTLATQLFGGGDPIGRRIGTAARGADQVVVGVVDDAKQTSARDQGLGVVYRPLSRADRLVFAIRTAGPPADAAAMVHHTLRTVASNLPITKMQTIEEQLDETIAQERLLGTLSLILVVIAVLIACVGLHALLSYDVAQRMREMGVRMAMGATAGNVAGIVLRDTLKLGAVALAVGVPIGVILTRPLLPQLYGIQPQDPFTLAMVAFALMVVTGIAALRPAHAAAKADPIRLLRDW